MKIYVRHVADWRLIREQKRKIIKKNNERENDRRIPHRYRRGDKILLLNKQANKYERPYLGPYKVLEFLPLKAGMSGFRKGQFPNASTSDE